MDSGYSPEEMRRYWREHSRLWADLDRDKDPEGLSNVCFAGSPIWLNQFSAYCQRAAFVPLLDRVGDLTGKRVLDVGCGVGRWTRLMADRGARVTGIDLQPETLRSNVARLPSSRFVEMTADSLGFKDGHFDLATSVTVLQHIPDSAQLAALSEIRRVLAPGGILILLECIKDRSPHMFSHRMNEWRGLVEARGFKLEKSTPYDFAPLIYGLKGLAFRAQNGGFASRRLGVEEYAVLFRRGEESRGFAHRIYKSALWIGTKISYPLEPLLMSLGAARWARHAGFLFRAV